MSTIVQRKIKGDGHGGSQSGICFNGLGNPFNSHTVEAAAGVTSADDTLEIRIDDHCMREQLADATWRPVFDPVRDCGTQFEPFNVPDRQFRVIDLPSTPVSLFQQFIPLSLVKRWVEYTNNGIQYEPAGPSKEYSRMRSWAPTSEPEVYLWLAIIIYMGLYRESRFEDHWKTSEPKDLILTHPIL
ncbi:Uncharacterized protein TPAR_08915 [Tolypocladium paradoxum]|uniref:PiggyBac transposable element-derived protein domain-containing protein n=1 Tax=Tolypocladium paradoxum TaxID=94208 RepID=A0A2S4KKV0_9HYPO|nr:Uncharacterized protein TPAR_08915 [Tolypocladium paradoxum]